ncbi:WAT1-related protein At5g40240-like isoform X2 [Syzygium oleosum]|uniref:WAT1-related protein At5g40240-like isoform X2 n=1 Tax=Syzygium oleosum TaxID=219896 RepID=UPI0024B9106A|nr:WAT1-related protein At5g40240-like isoform X2 [Syzygium oleosum]
MEGRARGSLPFVGMIIVILAQASNMVVTKMAMSDGINKYTMVFYCNALSSFVLLPFPLIMSRRFGAQISEYVGIDYSSPVLATAMMNLIPAFTFILAVILRMEKVNWKSSSSQAKLVGTIASIAGASVVTLYNGPPILHSPSPPSYVQPHHLLLLLSRQSNWILGGFLLAAEAFLVSLWYIILAFILKDYPVVLNIMFYKWLFEMILAGLLSFIIVREPQSWILKVDIGLIAILYSALVSSVFRLTLCTWCLKRTGPVYVSMFKPLGIVFAVGLGFIFLGEMLHLGSLIGAIVIVMGFYGVVWGKSKEEEKTMEGGGVGGSLASSSHKMPLLQDNASSV